MSWNISYLQYCQQVSWGTRTKMSYRAGESSKLPVVPNWYRFTHQINPFLIFSYKLQKPEMESLRLHHSTVE